VSTATESTATETEQVARRYFEAVGARDLDAMAACWAPDGIDCFVGDTEVTGPEGVRGYFTELWGAFPDFSFEIVDLFVEGDRCACRWRTTATFAGPGSFQGFKPTGARIVVEGCDVATVRDGKIQRNEAFVNQMDIARQLGLLPPQGSKQEKRMTGALNLRTRMVKRLEGTDAEKIAEGVWVVRGGVPMQTFNVYLIEDGDGVVVFDAGIRSMVKPVAAAAARLGGIKRVVLGHGHADHRGAAPGLDVPVFCHPDNRADAESEDGGERYFDFSKLDPHARVLMPRLLRLWDGGPVNIAGTVKEGDDVAGFRVIDLPGHAPGLIGLWRESDRLALVSDCFYTLDPQTGKKGRARVPHHAFNESTEQARESIRKLALLEPAVAWAGHADPVRGDVRAVLEQAADAP
jgi:steroid delta-isomerase-like uncharacterized protein